MVVDFSFFFVSKKVSLFWLKWKKAEAIVSRPRFGFGFAEAEARPALESLLFYGIEEVVDMRKGEGIALRTFPIRASPCAAQLRVEEVSVQPHRMRCILSLGDRSKKTTSGRGIRHGAALWRAA